MAHPLLGANIATLARVFRDGGSADLLTALGIWSAALAWLPFSALERAVVARRLRGAPDPPPEALKLDGFENALPAFATHLYDVRDHRKYRLSIDPEARNKVARALGPWIDKWGYADPARLEPAA